MSNSLLLSGADPATNGSLLIAIPLSALGGSTP